MQKKCAFWRFEGLHFRPKNFNECFCPFGPHVPPLVSQYEIRAGFGLGYFTAYVSVHVRSKNLKPIRRLPGALALLSTIADFLK